MEIFFLLLLAVAIFIALRAASETPDGSTKSPHPVPILEARLSMQFSPLEGTGRAAIEWSDLAGLGDSKDLRPFVAALLYARILVAHTESRERLFWLIDSLSKQNVRDDGATGFNFPTWTIELGHSIAPQHIWPWRRVAAPKTLENPSVYTATLLMGDAGGEPYFAMNLDMAFGQERILAPAAPLLVVQDLTRLSDPQDTYELAILLWQMNEYYGTPDKVKLNSEPDALSAAIGAIRRGELQVP